MDSSEQKLAKKQSKVVLTDVDDFIKDQEDLRTAAEGESANSLGAAKKTVQPPQRKQKAVIDIEALTAEAKAIEEIGEENWVGKLNEYCSANRTAGGLKFLEESTDDKISRFICTVVISETSHHFGGSNVSFSSKKSAKQYASKKAINWLIENKYMPGDGSVKFPKPVPDPSTPPPSRSPPNGKDGKQTYAGQVPEICLRLGYQPPTYHITPIGEKGTPFYNAYATFKDEPEIEDRLGEVQNVYGKKQAKEEVASAVIKFLNQIEESRRKENEAEDRKRNKFSDGHGAEET